MQHRINVNTLQQEPAATPALNEVGVCRIALGRSIAFDAYRDNRATGSFILIDRLNNATVAAGMIDRPLKQAAAGSWQDRALNKEARAELKGQQPKVLWFGGRADGRQETLVRLVEKKLFRLGRHTYLLDEESLRRNLFGDLPDDESGRKEQLRRLAGVAQVLTDAGLIVLVSAAAGLSESVHGGRELFGAGELVEYRLDADGSRGENEVVVFDRGLGDPEKVAEKIADELFA